jgi:hypothetical protein
VGGGSRKAGGFSPEFYSGGVTGGGAGGGSGGSINGSFFGAGGGGQAGYAQSGAGYKGIILVKVYVP